MNITDTALYFPSIRVPATTWFTQVLLYWDAAASIVPYQELDKMKLGHYMSELIEEGLIRPVSPDQAFRENARKFDLRFLQMLDRTKPQPPDRWLGIETSYEEVFGAFIHGRKGPPGLFTHLVKRGLAYPREGPFTHHDAAGNQWWVVEKSVADLYMAYLAGSICRMNPGFYPVSDNSQTLTCLMQPVDDTSSRLAELRYATIMHALPMPSELVPPLELARFKERHGDELRRLRIHLNGKLADLIAIDDEYLLNVKTESILQEIHDDVARLTEQMSRQPWPKIIFAGVAGVVAAGLTVGTAVVTGGAALALGLGIGGSVAALGPAVYQAADVIGPSRLNAHEPLAYAALAGAL